MKKILGGIALVLAAVILGYAAATQSFAALFPPVAIVLLGFVLFSAHHPHLLVAAFWVVFSIQTTIFYSSPPPTLVYYGLYALMLFATAWWALKQRPAIVSRQVAIPYMVFVFVAIMSLLWQPTGDLVVDPTQRLFIYGLAMLAALQIRTSAARTVMFRVITGVSLLITAWIITEARSSDFGYRAGILVNQNYLSTVVGIGLMPIFVHLIESSREEWLRRLLYGVALMGGLYAMALLASRGVALALLLAFGAVLLMTMRKSSKRLVLAVFAVAVVGAAVLSLPGADSLANRFGETSTESLNGRVPLWQAGLSKFGEASAGSLLVGGGMGMSEQVVLSVDSQTSIHNTYLQFLLDYGLMGTLAFGLLLLALVAKGYRDNSTHGSIVVGIIAFLALNGMVATIANNHIFWVAIGLTFPTATLGSRKRALEPISMGGPIS